MAVIFDRLGRMETVMSQRVGCMRLFVLSYPTFWAKKLGVLQNALYSHSCSEGKGGRIVGYFSNIFAFTG